MADPDRRVAFYALRRGGVRDWWTLLHPPYTAWHLSYVAFGAALAPHDDGPRLTATLLAFFFAVGVGAHALDEVNGHPLRTALPNPALWIAGTAGVVVAVFIGVLGVSRVGAGLVVFMVIGPVLLVVYNLEWFGGRLHNDLVFALMWGGFPVVTSYYAQAERVDGVALAGAAATTLLSLAQRELSTPARALRRRVADVDGTVTFEDGSRRPLDVATLSRPLERALHALSWGFVALAIAVSLARFR